MAYIARTDGSKEEIPTGTRITLEYAEQIIGGWVERVAPKAAPDVIFLCDEEGLLKNKPLNAEGCRLYGTAAHGQPIVGDIIVMSRKEARSWL